MRGLRIFRICLTKEDLDPTDMRTATGPGRQAGAAHPASQSTSNLHSQVSKAEHARSSNKNESRTPANPDSGSGSCRKAATSPPGRQCLDFDEHCEPLQLACIDACGGRPRAKRHEFIVVTKSQIVNPPGDPLEKSRGGQCSSPEHGASGRAESGLQRAHQAATRCGECGSQGSFHSGLEVRWGFMQSLRRRIRFELLPSFYCSLSRRLQVTAFEL